MSDKCPKCGSYLANYADAVRQIRKIRAENKRLAEALRTAFNWWQSHAWDDEGVNRMRAGEQADCDKVQAALDEDVKRKENGPVLLEADDV